MADRENTQPEQTGWNFQAWLDKRVEEANEIEALEKLWELDSKGLGK